MFVSLGYEGVIYRPLRSISDPLAYAGCLLELLAIEHNPPQNLSFSPSYVILHDKRCTYLSTHARQTPNTWNTAPLRLGTAPDCAKSLQHYLTAAKETIADLHSKGRGRIQRQVDLTRLSERFIAGRQPLALAERERADYWRAASSTGDIASVRGMGRLHLLGNG